MTKRAGSGLTLQLIDDNQMPRIAFERDRDGRTERDRQTVSVDIAEIRLPVSDGAVAWVEMRDVLEHVADEVALLAEVARVLAPSGDLTLRVPHEGPLAWFDALNIYGYLRKTAGRGPEPSELEPTGWHRHYRRGEMGALLRDQDLTPVAWHTEGIGLGDGVHLIPLVTLRWLLRREAAYQRCRPLVAVVTRLDRRIRPGGIGRYLTVEAVRR